jgi:hypothetical protein
MSTLLEDILFDPTINQNWHMELSERVALMHVLSAVRPEISIEIGTFLRGSLRPIAAASKRVYTFDIDPNQHRDQAAFPNVTFVTGDSAVTLPPLIDELNAGDEDVSFILVDGSHEENGVRSDLSQCVRYIPKRKPTIILAHDSSNPSVRRGIASVEWGSFPHVHTVNFDFVPGLLFDRQDIKGQIWGGLAAILLMPEVRSGAVNFNASFQYSLSAMNQKSIYA